MKKLNLLLTTVVNLGIGISIGSPIHGQVTNDNRYNIELKSVGSNTAQIVPNSDLPSSAYRALLNGVEDIYSNTTLDYSWVIISGDDIYAPDCSPIAISNNNLKQDAISQSVYRVMEISFDSTVAEDTTIVYNAEEFITLNEDFEVAPGSVIEAEIKNCEK